MWGREGFPWRLPYSSTAASPSNKKWNQLWTSWKWKPKHPDEEITQNLENLYVNEFLNSGWCCTAPWVDKNEITLLMRSKAVEHCSGVAKGGITDGRKQNISTGPQKIFFSSWFSPLDAASHTVHQRSEHNRLCGSTYSTFKLTFKIRQKNPTIMMYQKVVKTLLEWSSISFLLQIKVKYRHYILVSPEVTALIIITSPYISVRLLFIVVTFHLSTSVFWLQEILTVMLEWA